jgi:pyridoxamine 5'-phosphate oxidase
MSNRLNTLPEVEAACWRELAAAPQHRGHAWRLMTLATVAQAEDGQTWPDARTVVLREVQAEQRQLVFYTDGRSAKAAQLQQQPQATLVLWSRDLGWQLRLRVQLSLQTSGLAVSSRWAQVKLTPSAMDYLAPWPPGAPLQADGLEGAPPATSPAPSRDSRGHFAVVTAQVQAVDWLELHAEGHRRAAFDAQGARWLVP